MLLSNQVETTWNPRTKSYYESKGYVYTKMRDSFMVNVDDLPKTSNCKVDVQCDYCRKVSSIKWSDYTKMKSRNSYNQKDCCSKRECCEKKQKETCIANMALITL